MLNFSDTLNRFFLQDTRVSMIEYKNLGTIMPSTDTDVGSNIMSVSIQQVVGNVTKTVGIRDRKGAITLVLKTLIIPVSILQIS